MLSIATPPDDALETLAGVPETLVIPLYMRAAETSRRDAIIRDPKAAAIVADSGYDFTTVARAWMTQVDVAVRTELLDETVARFLAEHPRSVVVNLGAGLDGRFERLDDGRVRWFDVDLPEVIAIRRRFFTEQERWQFVARSLLDFGWIDDVARRPDEAVLVVAEGVLHYFPEADVRRLLAVIADRLPGAELLMHSTSPACVSYQPRSRLFRGFRADFAWGIHTARELEGWDSRYRLLAEWPFVDRHPRRWRWLRLARHLPIIGPELRATMKISHLRLGEPPCTRP
jgi:O-methyltransferase involved in polyketide biosynthesis